MKLRLNAWTAKSTSLVAGALVVVFFGFVYWQLDGLVIFAPEASATGRLSGIMAFGFFAVSGLTATTYCIEHFLAMVVQRTFNPDLPERLLRYPKVVTVLSAVGCVALFVSLKSQAWAVWQ